MLYFDIKIEELGMIPEKFISQSRFKHVREEVKLNQNFEKKGYS